MVLYDDEVHPVGAVVPSPPTGMDSDNATVDPGIPEPPPAIAISPVCWSVWLLHSTATVLGLVVVLTEPELAVCTCIPAIPSVPGFPSGPCSPVSPVSPCSPRGPCSPVSPCSPCGPPDTPPPILRSIASVPVQCVHECAWSNKFGWLRQIILFLLTTWKR
ncbi:MAG: hypothetical protein E4H21_11160 [Thermodesulfobacteriales bacterium]|nr:MAG: hypothetical protein E4H21_11160 [Thermodesulfobacteriales bacterium]